MQSEEYDNAVEEKIIICGDCNAHHTSLACMKDDARAKALTDPLPQLNLIVLNDGSTTFACSS